MCTSIIEALLSGVPFKPFSIHMQNGAEWEVDRPERVTVSGHQLAVFLHGTSGELLAVLSTKHIAQVTFPACCMVPRPPFPGGAS